MEDEGAAARDIMVNTGPIDLGGGKEGGGKVGDSRMNDKPWQAWFGLSCPSRQFLRLLNIRLSLLPDWSGGVT